MLELLGNLGMDDNNNSVISSLPLYIKCEPENCIYYFSKLQHKHYIIFCPNYNKDIIQFIYKYDLETKRCNNIFQYPSNFNISNPGLAIDPNNGDLYIFAASNKLLTLINIESKTIKFIPNNMLKFWYENNQQILQQISKSLFTKASLYLYISSKTKLHCIKTLENDKNSFLRHFNYDSVAQNFNMTSELMVKQLTECNRPAAIYVPFLDKIMVFADNEIFCLDLVEPDNMKWNKRSSTVLSKCHMFSKRKYALAFKCIIFVFEYYSLLAFDVLNNKWYKIQKKFPYKAYEDQNILISEDNFAYVIKKSEISTVVLENYVPKELYPIYSEYYSNVINKYMNYTSFKYDIIIPLDIHQIILNFYPLFVSGIC